SVDVVLMRRVLSRGTATTSPLRTPLPACEPERHRHQGDGAIPPVGCHEIRAASRLWLQTHTACAHCLPSGLESHSGLDEPRTVKMGSSQWPGVSENCTGGASRYNSPYPV